MNRLRNRNKPGFVNHANYKILMDAVENVPGIFAEFGVHKAITFDVIYKKAAAMGRIPLAVDSFVGMPEPTHPGDEKWPEGTFDTGGSAWFKREYPDAMVAEGFIPEVLEKEPLCLIKKLAFTHVDLDHYEATIRTLRFVWPLVPAGGIVACHDYNERDNSWAPKAIRDFMNEFKLFYIGFTDHSVWFRKGASEM